MICKRICSQVYKNIINNFFRTKKTFFISSSFARSFRCGVNKNYAGEYEYEDPKTPEDIVNVTYVDKNGKEHKIKGKVGDNVMYLSHRYGIELEGACEASLACCTCHVYVDDEYLNKIPEATDKEEDLLDMAPCLKDTSRLSCQITLCRSLEGLTVTLPPITRNFYVDGHVPQPH